MTPNEAKILTFIQRKEKPIGQHQIATQFSWQLAHVDLMLRSLMKQMLLEKDRLHYRMTKTALDELEKFKNGYKYEPFEGSPDTW